MRRDLPDKQHLPGGALVPERQTLEVNACRKLVPRRVASVPSGCVRTSMPDCIDQSYNPPPPHIEYIQLGTAPSGREPETKCRRPRKRIGYVLVEPEVARGRCLGGHATTGTGSKVKGQMHLSPGERMPRRVDEKIPQASIGFFTTGPDRTRVPPVPGTCSASRHGRRGSHRNQEA